MSAAAGKAWIAAASVMLVEALKDQGFARWNYPIRCIHQQAKSKLRSTNSQAKRLSSPVISGRVVNSMEEEMKAKKSEESFRKVMYLSCWGPN